MAAHSTCGEPAVSHNDELSLFRNEVADVRPIRNDHIRLQTAGSSPTDAQLARRQAATAEQLALDHLSMEAVEMLDPTPSSASSATGCRRGVYKKLRLGKYELQASLDLHQKTLNEARQSLVQFIADCELRDIRCLLILHGRGAQHAARPAQKLCQRLAAATAGGDGHPQRRASPRRRRGPLRAAAQERAQEVREPRTPSETARLASARHLVSHPKPGW